MRRPLRPLRRIRPLRPIASLSLFLLCACERGASPVDASAPVDLAPAADASLENAACEQALLADWTAHLPSLGFASAGAARSYDAVIGKLMADYAIPGGAVAVMKDGRLVFAKGYGFADRDAPALAHADDLFRIASVTKQLTAAAILLLVDEGKLSLDERAFDVLADLQPLPGKTRSPKLASITVRDLLHHAGGWNRDATFDPLFHSPAIAAAFGTPGPATDEQIVRYMLDEAPTYDAGTTYCYSNFGYCVLGRIVEKRGGAPYEQFVEEHVLRPLGAVRARLGRSHDSERADGEVRYYDFPGAPAIQSVFPSDSGLVPAPYGGFSEEEQDANGGFIASPIDLLRFQRGLDGRGPIADFLSQSSLVAMIANPMIPAYCNPDGTSTPYMDTTSYWYGFGWQLNKYGNWWHTGSLPGTATEVIRAANGFGYAAFFNSRPAGQDAFFSRLDMDLWTAFDGAKGDWPGEDYFNQYTVWTDWMAPVDLEGLASASGTYPVRLEGRLSSGAVQLRAQLAPPPVGHDAAHEWDLDCLDYRAHAAARSAKGYAPLDLQSFPDGAGRRHYQAVWFK